MSTPQRRPIIDPFLLALKSRRVLIATCALIVGVLVAIVPELEPIQTELLILLTTLALALIGGYSVEDAARASREALPPEAVRDLVKEVLLGVIDEIADQYDDAGKTPDEPDA